MTIPGDQREKLVGLLSSVAGNAKWRWSTKHRREIVISPMLRAIYRERGPHPGSVRVHSYLLHDDPLPLGYESLANMLRQILARYISPKSDLIGYGLVDLVGGLVPTKFDEFVKELIRGATLLGTEEAVTFLSDWLEQKTFYFEYHGVIQDAEVVGQPPPEKGMQIRALPKSSADLPYSLRSLSMAEPTLFWLGGCVLSVRHGFNPDFFVPSESGARSETERRSAFSPDYPGYSRNALLDRIEVAMSLATNSNVGLTPRWSDYGDLQAFRQPLSGGLISRGLYSPVKITDSTIRETRKILDVLPPELGDADRTVETIRILRSSFGRLPMLCKLISLRAALEILFGSREDRPGRKAIAAAGAEFLAVDSKEQELIRQDLCHFYGYASDVAHGQRVENSDSAGRVLQCAQGYVKRAVLKRLRQDSTELH